MSLNGKPDDGRPGHRRREAVTREDVVRAAARVKPDTIFYLTRP
jgi:hypothetical protein